MILIHCESSENSINATITCTVQSIYLSIISTDWCNQLHCTIVMFVAFSVCGLFRFVAILMVAVSERGRYDLLPFTASHTKITTLSTPNPTWKKLYGSISEFTWTQFLWCDIICLIAMATISHFNSGLSMINHVAKFTGPTWGPPGSSRPQMGPMLAPRTLLWGKLFTHIIILFYIHSLAIIPQGSIRISKTLYENILPYSE